MNQRPQPENFESSALFLAKCLDQIDEAFLERLIGIGET
jgi:hypothetical protein